MADGPWALLDGKDVCPRCQTPEETEEVLQQVLGAVRDEIDRRVAAGTPPDEFESGLIGFVMAHGDHEPHEHERSEPAGVDAADEPSWPHHSAETSKSESACGDKVEEPSARRIKVAVTGAFLTGHALATDLEGYGALQQGLRTKLCEPKWTTEGLHRVGGTYDSGGGFEEAMPLVVARRDGADLVVRLGAALDHVNAPHELGPRPIGPILRATPKKLTVDVYDLGVAVLTAWLDVDVEPAAPLEKVARAVRKLVWLRPDARGQLPPLAAALQRVASGVACDYGKAVSGAVPAHLPSQWLSVDRAATATATRQPVAQGRLLWLHPVNVVHADGSAWITANQIAPTFHDVAKVEGGLFVPGIKWSAVLPSAPHTPEVAEAAVRITLLHWAYFALYTELDRSLLQILSQPRWNKAGRLEELEREAEEVYAEFLRIQRARARLDNHLVEQGGDSLATWDAIARVQKFDELTQAVDRKLQTLEKVAQRRVEQASAQRERRISKVLAFLAVLTIVTVITAVAATLVGEPEATPEEDWFSWRLFVVVLAGVVAALVALLIVRMPGLAAGRRRARAPQSSSAIG
jgi:hypothetical protein